MKKAIITYFLSFFVTSIHADIVWPLYSQQCRDDAGPPFADDDETFGRNGFYHDKSAAAPILQNGKCAKPLEKACRDRPTFKAAYMEGPIECGNNGWYCRIIPDENWPAQNLISDLNFGHCNTTEGFEDAGYDRDGHCHGSSVDNTYYWWMRDHFHRRYNGRLRCCCGWYKGTSETPMYGQRIANRCDYRRLVTQTENLANCRDANEDHGLGFDDIGCDTKYESQLDKPIPENDDICWEISRFGATDEEYETVTPAPVAAPSRPEPTPADPTAVPAGEVLRTPAPSEFPDSTPTPPTDTGDCADSSLRFKVEWNDRIVTRDCTWVGNKATRQRCELDGASEMCSETCDTCDDCEDSYVRFKLIWNGRRIARDCTWVGNKATRQRCMLEGVAEACRDTCEVC